MFFRTLSFSLALLLCTHASAQAAVAFVQAKGNNVGSPTTITTSCTSTPTAGDLIIVYLWNNDTSGGAAITYTPPAGFTQIDAVTGTGHSGQAFWHIAGASDNSWVFTPSSTTRSHFWFAEEISGENQTTPIDAHAGSNVTSTTSWVNTSITATISGDLPVLAEEKVGTDTTGTWTNAGGFVQDLFPTTGGTGGSIWRPELIHGATVGTGAFTETSTMSNSSTGMIEAVLVEPASTTFVPRLMTMGVGI